jgi:hypothetical protein
VDLPLDRIWPFVEDFSNWAPLLEGYVAHERVDDRTSIWTLEGDLGPFSRQVRCKVTITDWTPPSGVAFVLEGIDEAVRGEGRFELTEERPELPAPAPRPWWRRLLDWFLGVAPPAPDVGPAKAFVTFTFAIGAQGPMAPMIDALLLPWSEKVAQGLLDGVAARLASDKQRISA